MKTFFKKLENDFLVESTQTVKTHHFLTKLLFQKAVLTKIEWLMQNGPVTKNGALPVTT